MSKTNHKHTVIAVANVSKHFSPTLNGKSIKSIITSLFHRQSVKQSGYWALKNIHLEVKQGEFLGIVGRNGSGKSTLLKLIAGVYTPSDGRIGVSGRLVPFIELGVGFNPELSAKDNVFLNGALLGFSRSEMKAMYDAIVSFAELEDHMDVKLKNFSSGMQVRLAFSIAIRAQSDILLIDEVLAVGDVSFQKKCFDYFRQLKQEGRTVVLVTHDMEAVRRYADRAVLIREGRVAYDGAPEEVSIRYLQDNMQQPSSLQNAREQRVSAATIEAFRLISNGKDTSQRVARGSSLVFEVTYRVTNTVTSLNIGIGVHSPQNGYVFGYNTAMDAIALSTSPGIYRLQLEIPSACLNDGEYFVNAVCFANDEADPFDYLKEVKRFLVVVPKNGPRYRGIVALDHTWTSQKLPASK